MKNNGTKHRELTAELESISQTVHDIEFLLTGTGKTDAANDHPSMSDLRTSELRYRRLFETAQDGILLLDAETGAITDANPFIVKMLGYLLDEMIGKRLWEIGAFRDAAASKAGFKELQQEEYIRYDDLPLQTKDGQSRQVEFVSNVYLVKGKKVIQCNIRDITDRKHAEGALKESEERYRRLFETAQDGVLLLNAETGAIVDANPFIVKMLGYSLDELIGKRLWEIRAFHDAAASRSRFKELQQEEYIRYEDLPLQTKDGQSRQVEFVSNVYLVKGKKVIQCNIRDVTDRKHAEGALKESEERYRRLFEAAQDGVLLLNAETGAIVDANPFIVKMLGYSLDELIGKRLWEIRAFHDAAASRSRFKELQQEEYIRYEDLPLQTKDGQSRQVEFVSNVYLVKGKKVIQCNIRDITERKQLEVHLEASEERYHLLFENSIDAIFLTSPDGRISAVNPAACQMFGGTEEEIKRAGRNAIVDSSDPRLGLALEERARTGKFAGELTFLHRNGTRISGEVSTAQYNDKEGDVRSSMIIRDITERKRTENALRESDEKFHQLADNITDAFWIRSPDMSEVHYVSPAFERIWGRSVESLFANPQQWPEFILAEDRERVLGAFAGLTEVGSSLDIEYRIVRPAGEIRWVRVRGFQVRDAAHKLIRHIGIVTDITDRKQVEVHLQQSEERYRRLVEFSPSAIMVHSLGKFVYVNPAAIKLLGASDASELLGKSILDIAHPDYKELVRAGLATGINESMVLSSVEEKFIRLDQTVIDVEVGALPIEYDGMPAIQYVVRDITQQKRLQQQLVLSQKGESIGTLAGGIAHDFNNILGIILGYTFLIAKNKSDAPKLAENIAAINQTVQRGAALVRQILTFARKTDVTFEPISLTELAQELISMFQQTFPKIITFTTLFPKDLPFILADKTQIDQAILNLCVNARDAMPTGGSITIKAEEHTGERVKEQFPAADQDSYICLSVSDNGEGMNEEVRRRMFDPFFTTKPQGKGTGLGLSVVYGVVQSHRGFINVESEVGQGTTFRLYFPVPNASVTRADARPVKQFESGGTETILVVEDESLLLEMVRFLLESKGYKVLVAHDGAEAIEQYKNHRQEIALVLTDLGLPKMTGAEEFKRLKEIDPDVKVVFASGFIDPDVKSELQKGGADDFLQKPYMAGEILQVVRSALDKQRAEG